MTITSRIYFSKKINNYFNDIIKENSIFFELDRVLNIVNRDYLLLAPLESENIVNRDYLSLAPLESENINANIQ